MHPLQRLLSVLILSQSNFQILHWKSKGKKFDRQHAIAAELYEKCFEDQDKVAEYAIMLGLEPANIITAVEMLTNDSEHEYLILDPAKDYGYDEFHENVSAILSDIKYAIAMTFADGDIKDNIMNVGIKADFETMIGWYDLQDRYLNTRRYDD